MQSIRLSRRNFLKLNAIVGSALAVAVAVPDAAAVAAGSASSSSAEAGVNDLLSQAPALRFGTPTDVAATWPGVAWSVDAEGTIRRFDRARRAWLPDGADDEGDFPPGSQLVLARWGRPAGPNQMLMVLA
jgi:hypothetical protein